MQERIDAFRQELKECIDKWYQHDREHLWQFCADPDASHPDEIFLTRINHLTSPEDFLKIIPERMSSKLVRDTIFDPFFSENTYTDNACWFKFAFDLAKWFNKDQFTWFSICFPNIPPYDPISFKPLFHTMLSLVYVIKRLPAFLKENIPDPRMMDVYFPKAKSPHPCYVFEKKTGCLYRLIPHPDEVKFNQGVMLARGIQITPSHREQFSARLLNEIQPYRQSFDAHQFKRAFQKKGPFLIKKESFLVSTPPKNRSHSLSSESISGLQALNDLHEKVEYVYDINDSLPNFIGSQPFYRLKKVNFSSPLLSSTELAEKNQEQSSKKNTEPLNLILNEQPETPLYFIDGQHLEHLITRFGGYPWFDLCGYILNDQGTLVYPLSSLFHDRLTTLTYSDLNECMGAYHWNDWSFGAKNKLRILPGDIEVSSKDKHFFKDIHNKAVYKLKPHHYAMHANFKDIQRAPLTLRELHRMTWKNEPFFYYHGNHIYPTSQRYLYDVLMPSWRTHGRVPKLILARLLEVFEIFFDLFDKNTDLTEFREKLNQWSSKAHFYPWDPDELQDRLFFYAQVLSEEMNADSSGSSSFLELFSHCFYYPKDHIYSDVLNMIHWISNYAPHFISNNPHFDPVYDKLKIARSFDSKALIAGLTLLVETANDDLIFSIRNLIFLIKSVSTMTQKKIMDEMVSIYTRYDQYVQENPEFEHTKPQSEARAAWRYFAEVLAGAQWIDDPVKLLCPSVKSFREPFIGMRLSTFDFQQLVFTHNRTILSALDSSKYMAKRYARFYSLVSYVIFRGVINELGLSNAIKYSTREKKLTHSRGFSKPFTPKEIEEIKYADVRYQQYLPLAYHVYQGERLSLSICLMIRYLIDATVKHQFINASSPRFVHEIYRFKPIQNLSQIPNEELLDNIKTVLRWPFLTGEKKKKIIIYIMLVPDGVRCVMQDQSLDVMVPLAYLNQGETKPLTYDILSNYFLKILTYLEEKPYIQLTYPPSLQQKCLRAYAFFNDFYKKMDSSERHALNNREILLGGKKKRFKDVLSKASFCMVETGIYLIALLINIDPTFTFHTEDNDGVLGSFDAEDKLSGLFEKLRQESYYLGYRDTLLDAEKLLISLMTTQFDKDLPLSEEESREWLLENCMLYDCANAIPPRLAKNVFYPMQKVYCPEKPEELYKLYIQLLKDYLYSEYYKSLTRFDPEQQYTLVKARNRWISSVIQGDMVHHIRTHNYCWFQKVYLSVHSDCMNLSEKQCNLFNSFKEVLKTNLTGPVRLSVNIKYLYFLRHLSTSEFLEFWREVQMIYRQEVLLDYLGSQGQRIDESHLVRSIQNIFKDEVSSMHAEPSSFTPRFYKSQEPNDKNSLFEKLFEHLLSCIPITIGPLRQPSTSPWNYI